LSKNKNNGLVSMRGLSDALGVTLKTVQNAVADGRLTITETRQAKSKQRHFFNLASARAQWEANRGRGRATRGERGQGPAPTYLSKEDKKRDEEERRKLGIIDQAAEANRDQAGDPGAPSGPAAGPGPKATIYSEARANSELYKSKMAELDYKVKSGELVSIEKAKDLFYNMAVLVKQNLLTIPDRISSILAAETDDRKIHTILIHEIKESLKQMSGGKIEIEPNGK
jgi:hypothetical protein